MVAVRMNEIGSKLPTGDQLVGGFLFALCVIATALIVRWLVRNLFASGHWVYEVDDARGALLYIGEARDLNKRMHRHESFQRTLPDGNPRKWWQLAHPDVRRDHMPSRAFWYPSKEIAKVKEREAIRTKKPPANQVLYRGVMTGGE